MDPYVKLAKDSVEEYLKRKKILSAPSNLPQKFYTQKNGVFVTIYNKNNLRGCIGTYLPTQDNVCREIIENAVSACSSDYRFEPITESELKKLSYEVSILNQPESIRDVAKLNPKVYGIIVRSLDGRSGLLLPNLKGVDGIEQQISLACQKAGINPALDEIQLFRFTIEKHS